MVSSWGKVHRLIWINAVCPGTELHVKYRSKLFNESKQISCGVQHRHVCVCVSVCIVVCKCTSIHTPSNRWLESQYCYRNSSNHCLSNDLNHTSLLIVYQETHHTASLIQDILFAAVFILNIMMHFLGAISSLGRKGLNSVDSEAKKHLQTKVALNRAHASAKVKQSFNSVNPHQTVNTHPLNYYLENDMKC